MSRTAPCLAVLAVLLAAAPASAGTISLAPSRDGQVVLSYEAEPGEANDVSLRVESDQAMIDDSAGVTPGEGCTRPDPMFPNRATCTTPEAIVDAIVRLKDRADRIRLTAQAARVEGGPGDDRLSGSRGDDVLVGGPGDDLLAGGPGNDLFDEGPGRNGADIFRGGRGIDIVSYATRTRRVVADFQGDADDGQRGEGDQIRRDVEELQGGEGNDRLTGNSRANRIDGGPGADRIRGGNGPDVLIAGADSRRNRLAGGGGEDELRGSEGPDVLVGGRGRDRITPDGARVGGNDLIGARDGRVDDIRCAPGPGADRVRADAKDFVARCGRIDRRGATPFTVLLSHGDLGERISRNGRLVELAVGRSRDDRSGGRVRLALFARNGRLMGARSARVRRRSTVARVNVRLNRWGRGLLRSQRRVVARAVSRTVDANGRTRTVQARVVLRILDPQI